MQPYAALEPWAVAVGFARRSSYVPLWVHGCGVAGVWEKQRLQGVSAAGAVGGEAEVVGYRRSSGGGGGVDEVGVGVGV